MSDAERTDTIPIHAVRTTRPPASRPPSRAVTSSSRSYLTGNDNNGDSFTLTHGANTTAPFVRGPNSNYRNDAIGNANIKNALQGISELQTVALTSYDGTDQFTMTYFGGAASQPIVRGQNNTPRRASNALQGGNEIQTVALTNFNAATANFQLRFNGGFAVSPVIGAGGLALTAFNIDAALNGLSGFAGTATSSAVSNTGFTLTFSGASANTNVAAVEVININGCPTCTVANRETARGGTAVAELAGSAERLRSATSLTPASR